MTPPPLPTPPALPEAPAPATLPALPARVGMAMLTTGGGSSTLAIALGRELAARGLGVRYCHCDPDAPRQLPGAAVLTAAAGAHTARLLDIDRALVGGIDAASQLLAWYDAAPFDLLHLHSLQAFGLPAAMLARLRGVPYVVTLHGSDVLSPHLMDANRAVVGDLLAGAAAITCVSAFLARQLERQLPGLGAAVVHNFLAHDFRPADLATTAETGAAAGTATAATAGTADAVAAGPPFPAGPRRRAHFVHISSLREVKRPQLLFAAFQQLRARHPAAHLAVVSTRRGLARAAELLPAYNLQGAVTLADGDDGPQALLRHYREATALVLTSRFESFGLVILEALAHGLPVVAPAVGGIPEVLGDDWPLLVHDVDAAPAYAAAMIAADGGGGGAVAGAMRTLAPRILQRFAPTRQVDRYLEVYRRALARTVTTTAPPLAASRPPG